jgi:cyclopropane fatty-acyl-phospholipid synthase-like methyltransferase
MRYDEAYGKTEDYFGVEPAPILKRYYRLIDKSKPVLDVGVGQGRNTLFLAREGFSVEAIDPSKTAIDAVSAIAKKEKLPVRTYRCGLEEFKPAVDSYAAILLFGLAQEFEWDSILLMFYKARRWTKEGGLIFVTAFTTADPSFSQVAGEWKKIKRNSFASEDGRIATFLEPDEILQFFEGSEIVHHWEGMGAEHRHGEGPVERHGVVEAVFRR